MFLYAYACVKLYISKIQGYGNFELSPMSLEHKWIPGHMNMEFLVYSKTCLKRSLLKQPQIGVQDQLSLNAGQKYCSMLQGEHSSILSTFIKH